MGKIEEDLRGLKTFQPNSFSKFISLLIPIVNIYEYKLELYILVYHEALFL